MRLRIAIILSRFLKPIALGTGIIVFGSAIAVAPANISFYSAIAVSFVTYWILEFARRFVFHIDLLEEASVKGETVTDEKFDSKFRSVLEKRRSTKTKDS